MEKEVKGSASDVPIFICRRGSLADYSIVALQAVGIVVVEADNPDECRFFRASQEISGGDMLWAAMRALNSQPQPEGKNATSATLQREKMIEFMVTLLESQRQPKAKPEESQG